MQQTHETVALSDLFHRLHDELVLIACGVGVDVNGGHFVLGGRDLVVLGLGEHAKLPQLLVKILHESAHAGTERTEVVVVELLTLGRLCTEEGAAAKPQVHAL